MLNIHSLHDATLPSSAGEKIAWTKPYGAGLGLCLSLIAKKANQPILLIAPDNLTISHLIDELAFFGGENIMTNVFPDWETLPYDHFSPHQDILSDRLKTLRQLMHKSQGITMTTVATLLQRLAPREYLEKQTLCLKKGDTLSIEPFRQKLIRSGYHTVTQVREHGEFAIRGSILDIYPMGANEPYRIDLFDNEVDSIRLFSIETQLSTEEIRAIDLLPGKEYDLSANGIELFRQKWRESFPGNPLNCPLYQEISDGIPTPGIEYYLPLFFDNTASLFDYLAENTLIITIDDIESVIQECWQDIEQRYESANIDVRRPILPPERLFLRHQIVHEQIRRFPLLRLVTNTKHAMTVLESQALPPLTIEHKSPEPLKKLATFIGEYPGRVLLCAETNGRREILRQMLAKISLTPDEYTSWDAFVNSKSSIGMTVSPIENSFELQKPNIALITENQLFHERVAQRRLRKQATTDPALLIKDLTELQTGDAVVHIEHGIGRYQGLKILTIGEQVAEFLVLEYQNNDVLYVPIHALNLISRYTGSASEQIPINKLGTGQWQKTKRQAAERIRDVAAELLDIYAKRAARHGQAFTLPQEQYDLFASTFPFEETPDQIQSINHIIQDMTSEKSMDRVICGDVGFGKTEVAMRAAFIAAMNHAQTCILVPTTLLTEQHYHNFLDRFADWPIKIESLSRFKTKKQQDQILSQLAEGKIDIIIGTHKLIQSNVTFKNLGLIVIDEEHRFGVKQKETLKALRSNVDVLTMTATPIPRTLNMALSGIRDLSIIATPPAKRLSVKTFVHEAQESIIKEAIQREIHRGGQVYFLHNDITSIDKKCLEIASLVHEARPIVAHGQMHERDLERIMSDFYHRRYNVLVCSTIIESGIDIPTANTIIIHRADKLGIAQLHQLRGRVGRSHHQAYAYLLVPSKKSLTKDALKRLEAIAAFDTLGIGFTLATHDLEIRGAGELLGENQSGDMHAIGFSLYMDLLSRAISDIKSGKQPDVEKSLESNRTEVDLQISALIPDDYLPDVQLRLQLYKRIASAESNDQLDQLQVEMIDRFGLLPEPCKNLFSIASMKLRAESLGITKIKANHSDGKFDFNTTTRVDPKRIIQLIQHPSRIYRLEGPTRLCFSLEKHGLTDRINLVNKHMEELA